MKQVWVLHHYVESSDR